MIVVIEYGDDWKLRNFFKNYESARKFITRIVKASCFEYKRIGSDHWYCEQKKAHIKIEA